MQILLFQINNLGLIFKTKIFSFITWLAINISRYLLIFLMPAFVPCSVIVATLSSWSYHWGAFIAAAVDLVMGLKPRRS
jgi:hypothetical protein